MGIPHFVAARRACENSTAAVKREKTERMGITKVGRREGSVRMNTSTEISSARRTRAELGKRAGQLRSFYFLPFVQNQRKVM